MCMAASLVDPFLAHIEVVACSEAAASFVYPLPRARELWRGEGDPPVHTQPPVEWTTSAVLAPYAGLVNRME